MAARPQLFRSVECGRLVEVRPFEFAAFLEDPTNREIAELLEKYPALHAQLLDLAIRRVGRLLVSLRASAVDGVQGPALVGVAESHESVSAQSGRKR